MNGFVENLLSVVVVILILVIGFYILRFLLEVAGGLIRIGCTVLVLGGIALVLLYFLGYVELPFLP